MFIQLCDKRIVALFTALALGVSLAVQARPSTQVKSAVDRVENPNTLGETLILPFAFSADSTGTVLGLGGMRKGFHQDQMLVGGAAYAGEDSYGTFAGVWDYRFPSTERTFLSVMGMIGYYPNHRAYTLHRSLYVPPGIERPGSNDSSEDLFLEARGDSNWWNMRLDYVLPLGAAREEGMVEYQLERGLLVSAASGGEHWDPRDSGVTIATLRQYNRYQSYETDEKTYDGTIHAFELGLLYDNTDFPINPSRGSSQYLAVHHDPAWLDSEEKWTFLEAEASKYFSLGTDRWASQRVLALNAWTAYSPSWTVKENDQGGERVVDGPPFMEGAVLGGFYRMRGYRDSRFHDKAAIYSTAEFRYTLRHNPIADVNWLRFLRLDWFQLVGSVEGGRVAPNYSTSTLFKDWKSNVGIGIRALTAGVVVRFDLGYSEEGSNAWVMVGHPF